MDRGLSPRATVASFLRLSAALLCPSATLTPWCSPVLHPHALGQVVGRGRNGLADGEGRKGKPWPDPSAVMAEALAARRQGGRSVPGAPWGKGQTAELEGQRRCTWSGRDGDGALRPVSEVGFGPGPSSARGATGPARLTRAPSLSV